MNDLEQAEEAFGDSVVECGIPEAAWDRLDTLIATAKREGVREFLAKEPRRAAVVAAICGETDYAYAKHGRDPWGRHEFYGILLEEVDELKDAIWGDAPQDELLAELRQVAAMCLRYAETGDRYRGAHPPFPTRALNALAEEGTPA